MDNWVRIRGVSIREVYVWAVVGGVLAIIPVVPGLAAAIFILMPPVAVLLALAVAVVVWRTRGHATTSQVRELAFVIWAAVSGGVYALIVAFIDPPDGLWITLLWRAVFAASSVASAAVAYLVARATLAKRT